VLLRPHADTCGDGPVHYGYTAFCSPCGVSVMQRGVCGPWFGGEKARHRTVYWQSQVCDPCENASVELLRHPHETGGLELGVGLL